MLSISVSYLVIFNRLLFDISGLYAPNAGIHYRDEQRRRRSQFDRGTTMAEHEGRIYYDYRSPTHDGYGSKNEDYHFGCKYLRYPNKYSADALATAFV